MKTELEISDARHAALVAVAGETDPIEYLQARVNDVLDSYVAQTGKVRVDEAVVKLGKMSEADRADVLAVIAAKPEVVKALDAASEEAVKSIL